MKIQSGDKLKKKENKNNNQNLQEKCHVKLCIICVNPISMQSSVGWHMIMKTSSGIVSEQWMQL